MKLWLWQFLPQNCLKMYVFIIENVLKLFIYYVTIGKNQEDGFVSWIAARGVNKALVNFMLLVYLINWKPNNEWVSDVSLC